MLGLDYLAWVGIVSWIVVPLLALFTTALLRRRSHTVRGKGLALVAGVAILSVPVLISNGIKAHYDRQVRELCAKDGGVRVYETVRLPAEKFNQWGQVNFYRPTLFEQNYAGSNLNLTASSTVIDDRESLYAHLDTLKTWLTNSPFTSFSIDTLTNKSAATLYAQSQADTLDGLATRYALYKGNAFVNQMRKAA